MSRPRVIQTEALSTDPSQMHPLQRLCAAGLRARDVRSMPWQLLPGRTRHVTLARECHATLLLMILVYTAVRSVSEARRPA